MSDDKVYKVWVEIEEYDEETGDGETMDSLGSSVATFDTYDEAQVLASKLQEWGEPLWEANLQAALALIYGLATWEVGEKDSAEDVAAAMRGQAAEVMALLGSAKQ